MYRYLMSERDKGKDKSDKFNEKGTYVENLNIFFIWRLSR